MTEFNEDVCAAVRELKLPATVRQPEPEERFNARIAAELSQLTSQMIQEVNERMYGAEITNVAGSEAACNYVKDFVAELGNYTPTFQVAEKSGASRTR